MMFLLAIGFGAYAFCVACWVLYLATMNLSANRAEMKPVPKVHAYLVLFLVGYPMDMVLNLLVGTVLFLDRPRDWVFTARLKRYHRDQPGTWRDKVATWICTNLLDPFAPGRKHC